jgi:hypothetical protein
MPSEVSEPESAIVEGFLRTFDDNAFLRNVRLVCTLKGRHLNGMSPYYEANRQVYKTFVQLTQCKLMDCIANGTACEGTQSRRLRYVLRTNVGGYPSVLSHVFSSMPENLSAAYRYIRTLLSHSSCFGSTPE